MFITAMRCDSANASSCEWVTKMKVMPTSRCSAISSPSICPRSLASSAPSGSSSSSRRGLLISPRASATRWRWPPESSCGKCRAFSVRLHEFERFLEPAANLVFVLASHAQREGDVLRDAHVREQRIALENGMHGPFLGRNSGQRFAVEEQGARVGFVETGDHAQQRRLAAARRAEQGEELAGFDRQRDVIDCLEVAEAAGNVADFKNRHARQTGRWTNGAMITNSPLGCRAYGTVLCRRSG